MLYVVVDEPHVEDQSGSGAGAKFFHQIMEDLLPYMNVYATNVDDVQYSGTDEPLSSAFVQDDDSTDTEDVPDTETDSVDDAAYDDSADYSDSADSYDDGSGGDVTYDETYSEE